ncbi:cytochrome P450 [Xylariaceae sp. FL1272]|nr:cytochrome P450 [Xylariaceae sp. FL1272]
MPSFTSIPSLAQLDGQVLSAAVGIIGTILAAHVIRQIYFHPLSSFPGPRLAAISDVWLAYHVLSGQWHLAVYNAVRKYGDIVRIAANELVFASPGALDDLYGSHSKGVELFTKTQINNHGNDEHGGLIWEWDPHRHRKVAKQIAPGFSGRALKAKEVVLHKYVDLFIERARHFGRDETSINISPWINWLCVDISADMAYNRQMNALENMSDPGYLTILQNFNKAITVIQMSWRFPLLSPLKYIFIIFKVAGSHAHVRDHSRKILEQRIRRKDNVEHVDFLEHIIPENREPPQDRREMRHLEQVAGQLLVAGYEPPAMWLYFTIYYLLRHSQCLETLKNEIRGSFKGYRDINPTTAADLPFLTACLKESLRLTPGLLTGMPVTSPGALVDGHFVPRGVVCQSSIFSLARNPRNFTDPLSFRPERWLPLDHPLYDSMFAEDKRKDFHPFSQGPRVCSGREIAWWQSRLFVAKLLWSFDLEMCADDPLNIDKDVRGWGMYVRPAMRVRFTPATQDSSFTVK